MTDIDGDGKTSQWEIDICKVCLIAMLGLAFGNELVTKLL